MRSGRKRKQGQREPSGRKQRPANRTYLDEKEARSVALEARQRVFGVTAAFAARMPEGTFIGRLVASGELSERQREAANEYRQVVKEYDQLHPVKGYPLAGNLNRGFGHDNEDPFTKDARRAWDWAARRYLECEDALYQTRNQDWHAGAVTRNVVLKGWDDPVHIGSLRIGLNALAHALGIPLNDGRASALAREPQEVA